MITKLSIDNWIITEGYDFESYANKYPKVSIWLMLLSFFFLLGFAIISLIYLSSMDDPSIENISFSFQVFVFTCAFIVAFCLTSIIFMVFRGKFIKIDDKLRLGYLNGYETYLKDLKDKEVNLNKLKGYVGGNNQ